MASTLEIAKKPAGNGMPIGQQLTPLIQPSQVTVTEGGKRAPIFDDNAAATIVWEDFNRDQAWLDNNAWLMNWQYVDYLYQSPDFDRDWRGAVNRSGRISRFNIAKNRNTMSTAVRRSIFADTSPVLLKPVGKLASDPHAQDYTDAVTELLDRLSKRADFEYNMTLFIEDVALQGTGIAVPGWEERTVTKEYRKRKTQPEEVTMPDGSVKTVNTWESDHFELVSEDVVESFPSFEYRRLGTTIWDEQWRTPNRPDLTAKHRIDVNYVTMQDLQQMRELDCYEGIPDDADLIKFFTQHQNNNAEPGTQTAMNLNQESVVVMHAASNELNVSANPFESPMLMLSYWTGELVMETLNYLGRRLTIRNDFHKLGTHALGYSSTWWNIPNCGYGMGIGRLNAGDQRMDQGVLNEVLKMIAYWTNAPLVYNTALGNAPTQNVVVGLGTLWGLNAPEGTDIRRTIGYMEKPPIPPDAWKVYELAKEGGEDLVGANNSVMQGNNTGVQGIGRTASGVNRLSSQADATVSDPVSHIEYVIKRWYEFMWEMVKKVMPLAEIRAILSEKMADEVIHRIDIEQFLRMELNIEVIAGQKLAAKAAIAQLIPFLLQLLQQPQLMEYMHQKGWTINFLAIEKIFLRVSELQGSEDIIVPLSDAEKQQVAQMNPAAQRVQSAALLEKLRGQNKMQAIQEQGKQDIQQSIVDESLKHIAGSVPLDLAEARVDRNTDMNELQQGIEG